ncbi:MAG TPA: pilus assembly protein PilP [Myxococcales bacterium]|jgi:type IV pilus assembly protein PilP
MRTVSVLTAIALSLPCLALAAETKSDKSDKGKVAPAPAAEHNYAAAGKRDPFKELDVVLPPPKDLNCGGLCNFDLEQFKVTALVTGLSMPLAGLEAPNGKVYIVDKGTKLGKRGGWVAEVTAEKIVIEEPCAKDSTRKCKTELAIPKDKAPAADEDLTRKKAK